MPSFYKIVLDTKYILSSGGSIHSYLMKYDRKISGFFWIKITGCCMFSLGICTVIPLRLIVQIHLDTGYSAD